MALDITSGVGGATTGAVAGGAVGGPVGAGVGGVLGGGLGLLAGGEKDSTKKLPTKTPEQMNVLNLLLKMISEGGLAQGQGEALEYLRNILAGDEEAFNRFSAPYMRQFEEQTVPGIAERFAGKGALGSSGFGQALSSAGAGLQEKLAALKAGLQQGAAKDLMSQYQNLTNIGLSQQPYGYQHTQGSPGLGTTALSGLASAGFPGLF